MWFLLIFMSASFSALDMIAMKLGVRRTDPVLASAISTIVVFVVSWMVVFCCGLHAELAHIDGRTFVFLVLVGIGSAVIML